MTALLATTVIALLLGAAPGAGAAVADRSCQDRLEERAASETEPEWIGVALDISSPPNSRISGASQVSGTARSAVPLSRADLVVAGSVVASQHFPPSRTLDFTIPWNAGSANVGNNTLQVVVCGESALGLASVAVTVPARRPVWVGLIVGATGVAGLVLSSAFRRKPGGSPRRRPGSRTDEAPSQVEGEIRKPGGAGSAGRPR